jgi:hypothetical protein
MSNPARGRFTAHEQCHPDQGRQEATRATVPTGGGGRVKLHIFRPCPLSHGREAAADKFTEPCGD